MNDVVDYLDSKNIEYKLNANEAVLVCPNCSKRKLSINIDSGVYKCWVCEIKYPTSVYAKGHVSQLKKEWGDIIDVTPIAEPEEIKADFSGLVERYHFELFNKSNLSKLAIRYLIKERGFSVEIIQRFKLGVTRRYNQNWISIPVYENNVPKLIKYRKLPPYEEECSIDDKCIREAGGKSILFNGDCLDQYDEVYVCEGEFDCMTLVQNGYENAVATTAGCGTLLEQWYDQLYVKNRLNLIFDTDDDGQGQLAARDIWATRLGIDRCYNVILPDGYDVNDYFLDFNKEDFEILLKGAKRFRVSGIVSMKDALQEMYRLSSDKDHDEKFKLPWNNINTKLGGGLSRKRLTVLGGIPGIGKTSFALQILYHLAKNYKIPGLIFCLEMPEIELATKIIQLERDLTYQEINYGDALIYSMELSDIPLYFGYSSKITADVFYNTMEEVRNRYGVQIGVFDNLQRMVRSDKESDIGKASGLFKDLAMDLNIPLILISQPRKLNSEDNPTYDDLKGSSAIPADADEVILLHRKRVKEEGSVNSSFEKMTRVIIDKSRFSSGGGSWLTFEGAKSKFIEEIVND